MAEAPARPELAAVRLPTASAPPLPAWMAELAAAPLLVAVLAGAQLSPDTAVFVAAPLWALVGQAGRIAAFFHAPLRAQLAPWAVSGRAHAGSALRRWTGDALRTLMTASVVAAAVLPRGGAALLVYAVAVTLLCELLGVATQAELGRRLSTAAAALQERLSGGLTLPQAAIHLYAPALAIAAGTVATLPAQLAYTRALRQAARRGLSAQVDALEWVAHSWTHVSVVVVIALGLVAARAFTREREELPDAPGLVPGYCERVRECVAHVREADATLAFGRTAPPPVSWPWTAARAFDAAWSAVLARGVPLPSVRAAVAAAACAAAFSAPWGATALALALWASFAIPLVRVARGALPGVLALFTLGGAHGAASLRRRAWLRVVVWVVAPLTPLLARVPAWLAALIP